jgi:hypothetical protein
VPQQWGHYLSDDDDDEVRIMNITSIRLHVAAYIDCIHAFTAYDQIHFQLSSQCTISTQMA